VKEGIVDEADIDRMARNIIKTYVAMGLLDRPVRDENYLNRFDEHNKIALQTAREGIVLLKNSKQVLPVVPGKGKKILLTGDFVKELARGRGAAAVKGYDIVSMKDAFEKMYGKEVEYVKNPSR
jgi:beta-glucosidase